MHADLWDALKPREERVEIAGRALVVRELETAADVAVFQDADDLTFKLLVRCVFAEDGSPAFTDEDIEALKRTSKVRLMPLVMALNRVNGFALEADVKNSEPAPA